MERRFSLMVCVKCVTSLALLLHAAPLGPDGLTDEPRTDRKPLSGRTHTLTHARRVTGTGKFMHAFSA